MKSKKIEYVCPNCKHKFLDYKNTKYCSQSCYFDYLRKHPPMKDANPSWKGDILNNYCEECGNLFRMKKHTQRFCSSKCRYSHLIGEKHPSWNKDRNSLYSTKEKQTRNSYQWKRWREEVFKRDEYKCKCCGINSSELHPHHIKPKSKYPELIFDTNNGITLCKNCHYKSHHSDVEPRS